MNSFQCTFFTPLGAMYDDQAHMVVAPGVQGSFGVLAGHEHLVSILKEGIVKIQKDDQFFYYVIDSGVLEVDGERHVMILADKAIRAEDEFEAKKKVGDFRISAKILK